MTSFLANHCFLESHRSKESKVESGHSGGGDGEMLSDFRDIWKSETESVDA